MNNPEYKVYGEILLFFMKHRSQSYQETRYQDYPIFLQSHVDRLAVLTSKSNKIYPFSLCVNIRARKLYTL
jgi:hypothetical protein